MSSRSKFFMFILLAVTTKAHANLEAHEWGTFTSLVGSNGVTQNGMYHEDEVLPDFVHGFGEVVNPPPVETPPVVVQPPAPPTTPAPVPRRPFPCRSKACFDQEILARNKITQKMETPVIYFYTDQAQRVDVRVRFPLGVVTESYPGPVMTSPTNKVKLPVLSNGDTTFTVNVTTDKSNHAIPAVSASNIYSHARNVNSNVVVGGNGETEKFIFYRGLGQFQPKLGITSQNGRLTLNPGAQAARLNAFLVHVSPSGEARALRVQSRFTNLPVDVSASDIEELSNHNLPAKGNVMTAETTHSQLANELILLGLHSDEAEAMIATWEHGYLHVPGLRLLYLIPRAEVDEVLPLHITPAPDGLVRVFVGRLEVMLDTEEQQILKDILAQGDKFDVQTLGRFAEPMLRRIAEVYAQSENTPQGVGLINRLVQKASIGFDTTAAVH